MNAVPQFGGCSGSWGSPHGSRSRVSRWRSHLPTRPARGTFEINEASSSLRRIVHAITALVLGLTSWILLGFAALTFARGALYPIFDHGPYGDAWGGPTLAVARVVHFLLSTVFQIVVLLLIAGVGALSRRLSAPYRGAESDCGRG